MNLLLLALALGSVPPATPRRRVSDQDLATGEALLSGEMREPGSHPPEEVQRALSLVATGRVERALDGGALYCITPDQEVIAAETVEECVHLLSHFGVLLREPPRSETVYDGEASSDLNAAVEAWDAAESPGPDLVAALFTAAGLSLPNYETTLGLHVSRTEAGRVVLTVLTVVSGVVAVSL